MKFVKTDYRTLELNPMTLTDDGRKRDTASSDQTASHNITGREERHGHIRKGTTDSCYSPTQP